MEVTYYSRNTTHLGLRAECIIKLLLDHVPTYTEPFCRGEVTLHETTAQFKWKLINQIVNYGKTVGCLGELLRNRVIIMKF